MSTDPLSELYTGKCHSQVSHEKHLLRMVVLIKVLVDTHATGCKPQQLTFCTIFCILNISFITQYSTKDTNT
jgi:hypothetical protein